MIMNRSLIPAPGSERNKSLFELPLGILFPPPLLAPHSSRGAFRCVFLSCLPKSLSVHFCNNNDRVGGPAGATNKERDLAWRSHCDFYFQVLESGIKTDRDNAWIMLFSLFFLPVCLRGNFASTCEYLCNTFISLLLEKIYICTQTNVVRAFS